jgi:hypothetical protein
VSVKNGAPPTAPPTGNEAGEAASAVVSVKNVNGLPPAGDLAFSAAEYFVSESATSVLVAVTRIGGSAGTVAVDYRTVDGSAMAGEDYTATSGTLVFGPGVTSQTIVVALRDDALSESTETLQVSLSHPVGGAALATPSTAMVRIQDNDVLPALSIDDRRVNEGDSGTLDAVVTVRLSAPSGQSVAVGFSTVPATATPGIDYVATSGVVTFLPGSTTRTISIPVRGDMHREPDETFAVRLSGPAGATLADAEAVVTIANDDPVPSCVTPAAGLVGFWPLDGNGVDGIGSANAVLQGGAGYTPAYVRDGLSLDGVDDAAVASDAALPIGAAARTLEFWMKPEVDARIAVMYGAGAPDDAFYVIVKGLAACIGHWNGGPLEACGTTSVADGQWHHVALAYDGGTDVQLFVDGHFEAGVTKAYATTRTGRLILGSSLEASHEFFRGQLDEVSVYNRALSPFEIEAIARADSAGKCCPCAAAPSGLVSAWSAEANANDRVGPNHALAASSVTFAAGQVGQAFALNGTDAYVEVPVHPSLDPPGQFSVEFWMRAGGPSNGCILYRLDNGIPAPGWGFVYYGAEGPQNTIFQIVSSDQNAISPRRAIPFDQWTHVAGTSDGTTMRFYVNGVEVSQMPSPLMLPSPTTLVIGACQRLGVKEQFFNGRIDELNVYNRALSAAEVRSIVNAGRAGMCR